MNKNYRTENKYKTNMGSKKRTVNPMYGREEAKKGGSMKKKKKSFPDMSGDGKVTKKDILIARGVIKKPMKKKKK